MNNAQQINQDSGKQEYWTPTWVMRFATEINGGKFDLDPACSLNSWNYHNSHSKFFHDRDGLQRPWIGSVWMNHPFSRKENTKWINKLVCEHEFNNVKHALCITYASTSELWFSPLLRYPQFYFTGRVYYIDGDTGLETHQVTKGSVLTFLPPKNMAYYEAVEYIQKIADNLNIAGRAK